MPEVCYTKFILGYNRVSYYNVIHYLYNSRRSVMLVFLKPASSSGESSVKSSYNLKRYSLDTLYGAYQAFHSAGQWSSFRGAHIIKKATILRVTPNTVLIKSTIDMSILISWQNDEDSKLIIAQHGSYLWGHQPTPCIRQASRSKCWLPESGTKIGSLHSVRARSADDAKREKWDTPWFPFPWIATCSSIIMTFTWQFRCFLLALIGRHISLAVWKFHLSLMSNFALIDFTSLCTKRP